MSDFNKNNELQSKLMEGENQFEKAAMPTPAPGETGVVFHDFDYKEFGNEPRITLSGLSLVILCPLLLSAHVLTTRISGIPPLQYGFVTLLTGFVINYTMIIRKYELMPFLPQDVYDRKLKRACVLGLLGLLSSAVWGWNGSGGIVFAVLWEKTRGSRLGSFGWLFGVIVVGSLLMEKNYSLPKLAEFIPGVLFGVASSTLFTLRESSTYAATHQFLFLCSVCLPMFFPAASLIVPSLFQWAIMLFAGLLMLLTILFTVKLMQTERVSVVMAVISGICMIATSQYIGILDFIGAAIILVGLSLVIKKQYLDLEY